MHGKMTAAEVQVLGELDCHTPAEALGKNLAHDREELHTDPRISPYPRALPKTLSMLAQNRPPEPLADALHCQTPVQAHNQCSVSGRVATYSTAAVVQESIPYLYSEYVEAKSHSTPD